MTLVKKGGLRKWQNHFLPWLHWVNFATRSSNVLFFGLFN
jgi:hypothetical protein